MMNKISFRDKRAKSHLPSDWIEVRVQKLLEGGFLIDHLDGNHGELYPSAEEFSEEGVPYVSANNFSNGVVDLDSCKKLPDARAKQFKKGIAKNDDVIFAHNATVGPVALLKTDLEYVILGTTATYYRCNNQKLLNHYLLYAMQSDFFVKQYSKVMFQSTRSQVPITAQRKLSLLIPTYQEQKAIAQVLSTADAAIHTTEKLIAQKERRKKWLMQQLLSGKKRLKGFGGEWKEYNLGDKFIERNETKYNNLPLLSIGQNGVYPQDESAKKDTSNEDKSKYKRICEGDIGYNTMRMWQGRSALSGLEGIVSPAYTVVTPKKNADSIFFSYLFKMPKMTNLFWRNSQGLVDDTLNCKFKDFSIVKVMLPQTKEEQTAIAQVLQAADKEISLLKAKAEKLREQKKGLMQVLLTGKKRLK